MRKKSVKKEEIKVEEKKEEIKKATVILEDDYYILKIGETLKDVADKFGLDEGKLIELNGEVTGGNQIKLK